MAIKSDSQQVLAPLAASMEMRCIADGKGLRSVWTVRQERRFRFSQSEFAYGPNEIVDDNTTWAA